MTSDPRTLALLRRADTIRDRPHSIGGVERKCDSVKFTRGPVSLARTSLEATPIQDDD